MCGVFGWVKPPGEQFSPVDLAAARAARDRLAHRGPDASGEWTAGGVYMGHRRLSIIDLSAAAGQPFVDPAGQWALSFNGEIYNYRELRPELERAGSSFRTASDTEVLLEGFKQWGEGVLRRADGMFAGALHDRKTGNHLLFRDPLGQKPLYWAKTARGVLYASELSALLSVPGISLALDRGSFRRFFAFGYYPWDNSPFREIRRLLPGHVLRIAADGGASTEKWWDSVPGDDVLDIGAGEAGREVERLFDQSCAQAMRSDVPFGVFLSGGVDSSLVLSSCQRHAPGIRSFSLDIPDADFNEGPKAAFAAQTVGGGEHQTFVMDQARVSDLLADTLRWMDEPHADPGYVNAYCIAHESRPGITVALAGDGADELFGGYGPFAGVGAEALVGGLPPWLLASAAAVTGLLPAAGGLSSKTKAFFRAFPAAAHYRPALWLATLRAEGLARLMPQGGAGFFAPDRNGFLDFVARDLDLSSLSPADRLLRFYQKVFLPEYVCHHTDRAAMRVGLEVRSPFLSTRLAEFVNRLPARLKVGGISKKILRDILAARGFPDAIISQDKKGFAFPLSRWLEGPLRPLVEQAVSTCEDWSDEEIDGAYLRGLLVRHLSGREDNGRILYAALVFQAWRSRHSGYAFA